MPDIVNSQVTDELTQSNLTVLGSSPAYALAQSELALAQSQGILFSNMVSTQHQQSSANSATITKCILKLYDHNGGSKRRGARHVLRSHRKGGPTNVNISPDVNVSTENGNQNPGQLDPCFTGQLAVY